MGCCLPQLHGGIGLARVSVLHNTCAVRPAGPLVCAVVLRKQLPDDEEANVMLFFGYVGLFCTLAFAPVIVFMFGTGAWSMEGVPPIAYALILLEGASACAHSQGMPAPWCGQGRGD